jgi:hypothetical protein
VIDENGLEIGNGDLATHRWTREDQEGESVIDLTLATRPIMICSILADDQTTGSNHKVLELEVDVDKQEEGDHESIIGWNLAAMMEKDKEMAQKH